MSKVIKVSDKKELAKASDFPYAKFPFETFNCVQSRVLDFYDKDCNAIIATKTSSGKTVSAEMILSYQIRSGNGKGMYLAPMKSLSQEKYDDWTEESHHFNDINVSICTGDYLLTPKRKKELNDADLIIMSSEMLNSRGRNFNNEKTTFINQVKTLVCDESHIISVPGRGDHSEAGLIKYSKLNPDGRIVFLSATLPNVPEIGEWLSSLNGKETYVLESDYRPCPLVTHYNLYDDDVYSYDMKEENKVYAGMSVIDKFNTDKFIVFGHTKKIVESMTRNLKKAGYKCEMHMSDLDKKTRRDVEQRFKYGDLQIIVATSTLAWGISTAARRVLILGPYRGLSEVEVYDITQMAGRAGRPPFDTQGDVHMLLPRTTKEYHIHRINHPPKIESQLFNIKNPRCTKILGFHLVSEINSGEIGTKEEIHQWYEKSLANFQNKELEGHVVDNTITELTRCGAVKLEDERLSSTAIGKISSMFYYSPFDVSDLAKNFSKVFQNNKEQDSHWVSFALGWTDTFRYLIVSKAEKEEIEGYKNKLYSTKAISLNNGWHSDGAIKAGYAYYCLLNGIFSGVFNGMMSGLRYDAGRVCQVLHVIDSIVGKWQKAEYFKELEQRIRLGVPAHLLNLCQLKGISKVKGQKLYDHGLKSVNDVSENTTRVIQALGCSKTVAEKIVANAKELIQ